MMLEGRRKREEFPLQLLPISSLLFYFVQLLASSYLMMLEGRRKREEG